MLAGKPEEKTPLSRPRSRWQDINVVIIQKQSVRIWIGFIWLKTGTSDVVLWVR
jgi:hypothetical protein